MPGNGGIGLPLGVAAATAVLIGIHEEVFYRGFLFTRFARADRAILWTALLFGLAHLNNLRDAPAPAVLAQVCFALGVGALYAVLRARLAAVWPLILGHALLDLVTATGITLGPTQALGFAGVAYVASGALLVVVAAYLAEPRLWKPRAGSEAAAVALADGNGPSLAARRALAVAGAICVLTLYVSSGIARAQSADIQSSNRAAARFHSLLNDLRCQVIYDEASDQFHSTVTLAAWTASCTQIRNTLGAVLASAPEMVTEVAADELHAPAGRYLEAHYRTGFAHVVEIETFFWLMHGSSSQLAGYHIRPPAN